nr:hypothetical protein [Actinocrinis puniceicyclus]
MAETLARLRATGWDLEGTREDLDPEGKRTLSALIAAETGSEFVFVTRFPASVRPFYHLRPADDPSVTSPSTCCGRASRSPLERSANTATTYWSPKPARRAWTWNRWPATWAASGSAPRHTAAWAWASPVC